VEYDLGDSDCEWLEEYNKVPPSSHAVSLSLSLRGVNSCEHGYSPHPLQEPKGGRRLSEDGLEFMIDRLEKAHCYAKVHADSAWEVQAGIRGEND
jgi:hypothetical protein